MGGLFVWGDNEWNCEVEVLEQSEKCKTFCRSLCRVEGCFGGIFGNGRLEVLFCSLCSASYCIGVWVSMQFILGIFANLLGVEFLVLGRFCAHRLSLVSCNTFLCNEMILLLKKKDILLNSNI